MYQLFLVQQNVKDLPGIGRAQGQKLEALGINSCADLQKWTLASLQKEFGKKLGEKLFKYCRGKDDREIELHHERKSVSAEINYGMRFTKVSGCLIYFSLTIYVNSHTTLIKKINKKIYIYSCDTSSHRKKLSNGFNAKYGI